MFNGIKWLNVEPSTRCNAWCSSCSRNKSGFGLTDFVIEDLKVERLKEVIDQLPTLETVQFCGNLGDPCASKIIDRLRHDHRHIALDRREGGQGLEAPG